MAGLLGLDLGQKRTGVAVAETQVRVASPLETFEGQPGRSFIARLKQLIDEYAVSTIVVGLPTSLSGKNNSAEQWVKQKLEWFKSEISGLEWILWDESLTSFIAEGLLQEQGVRRDKRKGLRDQLAAQQILQSYLDFKPRDEAERIKK